MRLGMFGDNPLNGFKEVEEYQVLVRKGTRDTFRAMLEQEDEPLIALAGYVAMKQRFPNDAYRYGLHLLCRTGDPPIFHALAMQDLSVRVKQDLFDDYFTSIASVPPRPDALESAILVRAVNDQNLYAWFHSDRREEAALAWRWRVLDSLLEKRGAGSVSPEMRAEMLHASRTPGFGRSLYIMHARDLDDHFAQVLFTVLRNDDLKDPSTILIIRSRSEFIQNEIDLSSLPADRRDTISRLSQKKP